MHIGAGQGVIKKTESGLAWLDATAAGERKISESRNCTVDTGQVPREFGGQISLLQIEAMAAQSDRAVASEIVVSRLLAARPSMKPDQEAMVRRLLGLVAEPSPDAADALACAICHAHGGHGFGTLATTGYRIRNGRLV